MYLVQINILFIYWIFILLLVYFLSVLIMAIGYDSL